MCGGALVTCFGVVTMWIMDRYAGCPMCCIGDPSHCQIGACIKYVFSSSLFQCSSHGNCKIHVICSSFSFNLFGGRVFIYLFISPDQVGKGALGGAHGSCHWLVSPVLQMLQPLLQLCGTGTYEDLWLHHWTFVKTVMSGLDIRLSFVRWFPPSLTAGLKGMRWMWHAAIQRDGSEGKSRQGKNSLREGWNNKQNRSHCKDSGNMQTKSPRWPHAWPTLCLCSPALQNTISFLLPSLKRLISSWVS